MGAGCQENQHLNGEQSLWFKSKKEELAGKAPKTRANI